MNKNLGIVFVVTIQFIKFGLVGGINTIISLAIYYLFLMIDPELYLLGNVTGFVVSTLNAYLEQQIRIQGKHCSIEIGRSYG